MPHRLIEEVFATAGFEEECNIPPKDKRGARAMAKVISEVRKAERQFENAMMDRRDEMEKLEKKLLSLVEELRGRDQTISDLRRELDKARLQINLNALDIADGDQTLLLSGGTVKKKQTDAA